MVWYRVAAHGQPTGAEQDIAGGHEAAMVTEGDQDGVGVDCEEEEEGPEYCVPVRASRNPFALLFGS